MIGPTDSIFPFATTDLPLDSSSPYEKVSEYVEKIEKTFQKIDNYFFSRINHTIDQAKTLLDDSEFATFVHELRKKDIFKVDQLLFFLPPWQKIICQLHKIVPAEYNIETLCYVLIGGDFELLKLHLNNTTLSSKEWHRLWKTAQYIDERQKIKLLAQKHYDHLAITPEGIKHFSAITIMKSYDQLEHCKILLQYESDKEKSQQDLSTNTYNLSFVDAFAKCWDSWIQEQFKDPCELGFLSRYFLHSPLSYSKKLCDDLKKHFPDHATTIQTELSEFLKYGSCISHYTGTDHMLGVQKFYHSPESHFYSNQVEYGKKIFQVIDDVLGSYSGNDSPYERLRTALKENLPKETFFELLSDSKKIVDTSLTLKDPFRISRYCSFLSAIRETFTTEGAPIILNIHLDSICLNLAHESTFLMRIIYPIQKKYHSTVDANNIYGLFWTSPPPSKTKQQQERFFHIEQLLLKSENEEEFQELFMEGYWLGCQLNLVRRGSSQLMQCWLVFFSMFKGYQPPIPSKKYPEPNPVAISMPLDSFKKKFRELFENCFEKSGNQPRKTL